MDPEVIQRVRDRLIGATCGEVDCEGGILQLAFGTRRLVIQSCWRLSRDDTAVTSGSPDCAAAKAVLLTNRVTNVAVQNEYHDLLVDFENGARLETFADAVNHEHWNLVGDGADMIVAGPGRLWSSF